MHWLYYQSKDRPTSLLLYLHFIIKKGYVVIVTLYVKSSEVFILDLFLSEHQNNSSNFGFKLNQSS